MRTNCPECGEVALAPSAVRVTEVRGRAGRDVSFTCPSCDAHVRGPVDVRVSDELLRAGVPLVCISPSHPATGRPRPPHPEQPPPGPRFTPDDVIEMHLALERPDWFLELLLAFD